MWTTISRNIRGNQHCIDLKSRLGSQASFVANQLQKYNIRVIRYWKVSNTEKNSRKRLVQKLSVCLPHFSAKYVNCPFEVSSWLSMRKTKTVTKIRKESAVVSFLNAIQCKHRGDYRYQTIKENKICQCMTESIICFVFLSLHQLLLSLE